ncbi:MAG: hypothetical protein R3268_03525, partial [Acidiferrobacterales bacterium]|nr:hypothetical protein [Acidiferrobacterales bacterium]
MTDPLDFKIVIAPMRDGELVVARTKFGVFTPPDAWSKKEKKKFGSWAKNILWLLVSHEGKRLRDAY